MMMSIRAQGSPRYRSAVRNAGPALGVLAAWLAVGVGCGDDLPGVEGASADALAQRAYVVSKDHGELTVIDLRTQAIVGRVDTLGVANHMAETNADLTKVYVDSSDTNETIVVDARTLQVKKRIPVGAHPTHLTLTPDGRYLVVMAEDDDSVVFVDTERDEVAKVLPGFHTPHFMRFAPDGSLGYVANIGACHITRVDLGRLEIVDHLALDGFDGPPNAMAAPDEGGFADVQIDAGGVLYAAHHATGRVLVYDTLKKTRLPELQVGKGPWVVFAEHPFANLPRQHLVPNFGDMTVSLIDGPGNRVTGTLPGDQEAYGVNVSSQAPGRAFVMNRIRQDVAVFDSGSGQILGRIPVGGNTETAATTADGRFIVAAVSGADRVVMIDPQTNRVVKAFEGVGKYPWSVTIPHGQNYCH
jgi:YVTN family beta-propeller protein